MKKFISILILLVLALPVVVNALVDDDTQVGLYNTLAECNERLALNDATANSQATGGYYLTCLEVTCVADEVVHNDLAPFSENVTCANGNENPFLNIRQSGITLKSGLELDSPCSYDAESEYFFENTFATVRYQFNCVQDSSGGIYNSTSNNTGDNNNTSTSNNTDEVTSPETGINTYYIALASLAIILSIGLYIINKKNLFKKI